ncbi:MAG: hypothetical protein LBG58_04070 [Planctomycetaceae bacterium]|jgi:hypothetical protein|nr:hypothetical protein [Planctomycetaceae bacterium]
MQQENDLTELASFPGIKVTQFFVSVTFLPESIKNNQSNELFLDVVSVISDTLNSENSLVRWSVQSIRTNLLEGAKNENV